jgi:glycine dehydrogenase subunit 1
MKRLSELDGVAIRFKAFHFKEFVVDFSATGRSVREINGALLADGIFGGHDLGAEFEALKGCALYAVTEVITREDIDRLVSRLAAYLS